ncbi:MAG: HupE/UreJ family protein [Xanthobacteraceae bacterium]
MDHTARLQSAPSPILNQWRAVVVAAATMLLLFAVPALAHTGSSTGGFIGGFAHPLFGLDHVVAMVAVGLWGAFLGPPAIWLLPIVFPLVMAFGGVIGILGVPLPGVETAIALSAIVLGTMVALAARPPLWVAALIVGAFAIFHGHAHGAARSHLGQTSSPIPSASWSQRECSTSPVLPLVCSHDGA